MFWFVLRFVLVSVLVLNICSLLFVCLGLLDVIIDIFSVIVTLFLSVYACRFEEGVYCDMYAFVCVCISMCGWFSWFVFILKDFGPFLCVFGYGSVLDFGVHMLLFLFCLRCLWMISL